MDIRVDCIVKPDRYSAHERIQRLGGRNSDGTRWQLSEDDVIKWIRAGHTFYTNVSGARANVIIAQRNGRDYLKTDRDTTIKDNLLSLQTCSLY